MPEQKKHDYFRNIDVEGDSEADVVPDLCILTGLMAETYGSFREFLKQVRSRSRLLARSFVRCSLACSFARSLVRSCTRPLARLFACSSNLRLSTTH
jgi:hypothetical protein